MSLGVRWGLEEVNLTRDTVDQIHLSIKSLHNSSSVLLDVVERFVLTRTRFRTDREGAAYRYQFWLLCGVPPDCLETVRDEDPWWDELNGCLWVD